MKRDKMMAMRELKSSEEEPITECSRDSETEEEAMMIVMMKYKKKISNHREMTKYLMILVTHSMPNYY